MRAVMRAAEVRSASDVLTRVLLGRNLRRAQGLLRLRGRCLHYSISEHVYNIVLWPLDWVLARLVDLFPSEDE
jgi:hypothetical protein